MKSTEKILMAKRHRVINEYNSGIRYIQLRMTEAPFNVRNEMLFCHAFSCVGAHHEIDALISDASYSGVSREHA